MKYFKNQWLKLGILTTMVFLFFAFDVAHARVMFQWVPSLAVKAKHTDNLLLSSDNEEEEYITSYAAGLTFGIIDQKGYLYARYEPEYRDYDDLDDRDRMLHPFTVDGKFLPNRLTEWTARVNYAGDSKTYEGESRSHVGIVRGKTQMAKRLLANYGYQYENAFHRLVRDGNFIESDNHRGHIELVSKYGSKSKFNCGVDYAQTDYDGTNSDSFHQYQPKIGLDHWFSPLVAVDLGASYLYKEFDDSEVEEDTYSGYIRYLQALNRRFDIYMKYRHTYSESGDVEHHIFHPSVGFDWTPDEDSGISLGAGVLFHDWNNDNDDDPRFFGDVNAYRRFEFSRKNILAITASSGYSESSEEAGSLGYNIYYRAGARYDYLWTRYLSSYFHGSYRIREFRETSDDRTDEDISLGAGFAWDPCKWLRFNFDYTYREFDTDDTVREDYSENTFLLSIRLIFQPSVKIDTDETREDLENLVFQ